MAIKLDHTNRDRVNFDINETAELLEITTQQVRKLIVQEKLNGRKVGGIWWITKESIEQYSNWG